MNREFSKAAVKLVPLATFVVIISFNPLVATEQTQNVTLPSSSSNITTLNQTNTTTTSAPNIENSSNVTTLSKEEIKKIIFQHSDRNHGENRLALNKPTLPPQMIEFAPESMEAQVSEATSSFGMNFINNVLTDTKENIVISPLSLQNVLGMLLLGAGDNSTTEHDLLKVLNYNSLNSSLASNDKVQDRLKVHEAMHNVFKSILDVTHLNQPDRHLLNTNPNSLQSSNQGEAKQDGSLTAQLQTSSRDGSVPLNCQVNFTLANLLLTNKDMINLDEEYKKDLKKYYDVKAEEFSRDKEASKDKSPLHERVNKWVKSKTRGQIEKLAEEADLSDANLMMVLLNAAHFKGRWLHTFNTQATYENIFFNNGLEKGSNMVKFMRQKSVFGYAEFGTSSLQQAEAGFWSDSRTKSTDDSETLLTEDESTGGTVGEKSSTTAPVTSTTEQPKEEARLTSKLNCSVLMLPFSLNDGQELSMVILLPTKRDGIAELQAGLDGPTLNEVYKSLTEQQVQVELPKFSFEATHDAKAILTKMGLKSVFEDVNLNRMVDSKSKKVGLKVDKVIHKAKINVDESGAEAAAASMITVALRNFVIRPPAPVFVANHPFLFIIRHTGSNMPLFMGRVSSL